MNAVCSHEGGPLEEGTLEGYNLTCPWHYAIFDVRNAKVSDQTVWATDLNSYAVQVEEATGDILISLDTSVAASSEQQQQAPSAIIQRQQNEEQAVEVTKADSKEKREVNEFELVLLEKQKYNGTDVMSLKFSKQDPEQKKELDYISGQYAFFDIGGVYNDPEGPIRHFTIASSPTENFIMISTRIRDTPYKKRLSSLGEEEEKAKVKVRGPTGKFILHEDYSKPAVLLSGGIGVTPFRSMIKYATDKQLPIKIVMFDSNRNISNILYKEEFDDCLNKNTNLKIVYTITEKEDDNQPAIISYWC